MAVERSRRDYLKVAISPSLIGLSGCISGSNPPSDDDFSFQVTVQEQFTKQHPGRISVRVKYEGGGFVTLRGGPELPFSNTNGVQVDGDSELAILPYGSTHYDRVEGGPLIPEKPVNGCWRIDYGLARHAILLGEELQQGEVVSTDYAVLDSNEDGPCLPQGTYEFSSSQMIDPESISDDSNQKYFLDLGFSLLIHADHRISVVHTSLRIRSESND